MTIGLDRDVTDRLRNGDIAVIENTAMVGRVDRDPDDRSGLVRSHSDEVRTLRMAE